MLSCGGMLAGLTVLPLNYPMGVLLLTGLLLSIEMRLEAPTWRSGRSRSGAPKDGARAIALTRY